LDVGNTLVLPNGRRLVSHPVTARKFRSPALPAQTSPRAAAMCRPISMTRCLPRSFRATEPTQRPTICARNLFAKQPPMTADGYFGSLQNPYGRYCYGSIGKKF
jgi:hypothetical protein